MLGGSSAVSRSMARTADDLDGPVDVNELLELICLAAIDAVPGADYAGITLADRHGKLGGVQMASAELAAFAFGAAGRGDVNPGHEGAVRQVSAGNRTAWVASERFGRLVPGVT